MASQVLSTDAEALESDRAPHLHPAGTTATHWLLLLGLFTVVLVFVTYWAPMLSRDLRFDENLTGWVIGGSLIEAIERSWVHQGQSPLYFLLLWLWQSVVGGSELALRVPSMIALALSVWQLAALGRELDHRRAGHFAAVFLLVFEVGAADARPYVFMILALVVSARFGLRWLSTSSRRDGLLWVGSAAAAIAMQPFAVFALVPHAVLAVRAIRRDRTRGVVSYALIGALLVAPIVPQLLMLRARQDTLVIAAQPTVTDLLVSLVPAQLFWGFVVAALLDRRPRRIEPESADAFLFTALWAVTPAVGLFSQSWVTGSSVFVERYYSAALPAAALLLGMFLTRIRPAAGVFAAVAVVIAGLTVTNPVGSRDWYAAVDALAEVPEGTEIWTVTGYIESNNPDAFADLDDNEYLNAPLRWHGAQRDLLAIPRTDIDANRSIIDANIRRLEAMNDTTVVLVESVEGAVRQSGPVYAEEALDRVGFAIVDRRPEFGVMVTTFERR